MVSTIISELISKSISEIILKMISEIITYITSAVFLKILNVIIWWSQSEYYLGDNLQDHLTDRKCIKWPKWGRDNGIIKQIYIVLICIFVLTLDQIEIHPDGVTVK
jgi:hypothetical protein